MLNRSLVRALEKLDRVAARTGRLLVVGALVSILLLAALDYATGPNVAFSVFYMAPISVVAWAAGARAAVVAAAISALGWGTADVLAGADYSTPVIPVWNTLSRFVVFTAFALLTGSFRSLLRHEQSLARTDPTTGCANSLAFEERAGVELARLARDGRPLTLAYIDLDDFKAVNDSHGHRAGDDLLARVGRALVGSTRELDVVARIGGDEFAILLPDTDKDGADTFLKNLRGRVASAADGWPADLTFSLGAVTFVTAPAGVDEMIAAADKLMYEGKESGKNGFVHEIFVNLEEPHFERRSPRPGAD